MALGDAHAPGATPLDPDELADLIPDHISTQAELNEWEQSNIIQGQEWALRSRRSTHRRILKDEFIRTLHRRMFDQTWKWSGTYRTSGKNFGIDWPQIPEQVRVACDNAQYWVENHVFEPIELSVRLHHRLVVIHPFPNGNGRHARLLADLLLLRHFKVERPPWGGQNLSVASETRDRYLQALREADCGNFVSLISFARED